MSFKKHMSKMFVRKAVHGERKGNVRSFEVLEAREMLTVSPYFTSPALSVSNSDIDCRTDTLVAAWQIIGSVDNEIRLNWSEDASDVAAEPQESSVSATAWEEPEIRALEIDDALCNSLNAIAESRVSSDGSSSNMSFLNGSGGSGSSSSGGSGSSSSGGSGSSSSGGSGGSSSGGSSSGGSSSGGSSSGGSSSGGSSSGGSSSGGSSSGGSGGSSSGGSGGSSSGGYVSLYLSGGTGYRYEGESVYISYSGLPSNYSLYALVENEVDMVNNDLSVLEANGSFSSGSLVIHTIDDRLPGDDKTMSVRIFLVREGSLIDTTSFDITFLECPEFISDVDIGASTIEYNIDVYHTYIMPDAVAGDCITFKGVDANGNAKQTVSSKGTDGVNGTIRYKLIGQSDFFEIDEYTGRISLKVDALDCVIRGNSSCQYDLTIYAYESRCVSAYSGGSAWCDSATVRITFSSWNVLRNGANLAVASPSDGCTISMLADYIGLELNDFRKWLTVDNGVAIQLFNGETKTIEQLQTDDVLASDSFCPLYVPNTVYAVWCWNPYQKESMCWNANCSQLSALGFKVEYFLNEQYRTGEEAKRAFFTTLQTYSNRKYLHGLYLTGHGSGSTFGPLGEGNTTWEPAWIINYYSSSTYNDENLDTWGINQALNYKLGAFVVHACHSDNTLSRTLVSSNGGLFWGFRSTINSGTIHAFATLWGCVITSRSGGNVYCCVGGLQGANWYSCVVYSTDIILAQNTIDLTN